MKTDILKKATDLVMPLVAYGAALSTTGIFFYNLLSDSVTMTMGMGCFWFWALALLFYAVRQGK